jgi:tetratricopeptide (TPR) repeat protein
MVHAIRPFLPAVLILLVSATASARASYESAHEAAMAGSELSQAAAAALERKIEQAPHDLETRTVLLGYYFRNQYDAPNMEARRRHVLWVIRNHPESEIAGLPYAELDAIRDADGYRAASAMWKEQVKGHADDVDVLRNASSFFELHDATLASELLERAAKLEPSNAEWPGRLGDLHSRSLIGLEGEDERRAVAARALGYFERALALATSDDRSTYLEDAAEVAFLSGAVDKARKHANELLATAVPGRWDHGNALHHANTVLGRIALREGDLEAARRHLLASATEGSPQLDSFGPDMNLAKELLERGEREAVLAYFDLCEKFWEMGKERLADWKALVKAGRTPDWGASLSY